MAKLVLTDLTSLTNEASALATLAANNAATEAALEKTLSRDGTAPNTMTSTLDMNSQQIINLPSPATDNAAARRIDVTALSLGMPLPYDVTHFLTVDPSGADGNNIFAGLNVGNITLSTGGGAANLASKNIGLGKDTLYSLTTGYGNIGYGHNILQFLTTGSYNIGIGDNAMASATTASNNVAIGVSAMYRLTTGTHNTAVGLQTFYNNTTGSHNTYIGRDAGFSNTTGDWNTGCGVDANPGNTTGTRNTAVGGEAGYTENLANQNVTGSQNTWVGSQSGPANTSQFSNTIALGYRAHTTASNQAVLGNSSMTETIMFGVVKPPALWVTGTGGAGYIELPTQTSGAAAGAAGTLRVYADPSQRFTIKNASNFAAGISLAALTASRNYTLPDADGTFLYSGGPLGTPASGVATNLTGTAAGLTAGNVTTNANLTGEITSVGNAASLGSFSSAALATALTDETGTGSAVFANSPVLVTPALGTPASGIVTNLTGTASININGTVGATTPTTVSATLVNVTSSTLPSNGIYLPTANNLGFATNGVLRGIIDSAGNVSFGDITTPSTYNVGSRALLTGSNVAGVQSGQIGIVGRQVIDGTIGDVTFHNAGTAGEGRIAFIRASRSGADNSGKMTVYVYNAGTPGGQFTVDPTGYCTAAAAVAVPAGGSSAAKMVIGSTAGFGTYVGSGAPSVSAAKGSLYLRTDGSTTTSRMYVNTDGATTWTAVTTVA